MKLAPIADLQSLRLSLVAHQFRVWREDAGQPVAYFTQLDVALKTARSRSRQVRNGGEGVAHYVMDAMGRRY